MVLYSELWTHFSSNERGHIAWSKIYWWLWSFMDTWHLLFSADKTSCATNITVIAQKRQYKEMKVVVAGFSLLFFTLLFKPKTYWGLFWFAVEAWGKSSTNAGMLVYTTDLFAFRALWVWIGVKLSGDEVTDFLQINLNSNILHKQFMCCVLYFELRKLFHGCSFTAAFSFKDQLFRKKKKKNRQWARVKSDKKLMQIACPT